MGSVKFESIWILMSKFTFIPDSNSIQDDLTCVICKKLMIDSFQSECGCQYCFKCIQEYLGGENKYCPGNKRECKEEYILLDVNVFRNAMLNKKLSKLIVQCPNQSCRCVEELSKMEDHLRSCVKQIVCCPYVVLGCDNEEKEKDKILSHLSEDTLNHTHLILESIQNIKNEVSTLKEESRDNHNLKRIVESLKGELDVTKSKILSLQSELLVKETMMSELMTEVGQMKDNFQKSQLEIVSLKQLVPKYEVDKTKNEITRHESSTEEEKIHKVKEQIISMNKEIQDGKRRLKDINDEIRTLKRESARNRLETDSKVKNIKEESDKRDKAFEKNVNKSMEKTNKKIDILKEIIERTDVWTNLEIATKEAFFCVDRFSFRKSQNIGILSPYFYSHSKGYKLRLRVYPGGNGTGSGTHLSVYFVMCKGEYDDQLPWPCNHSIKISIINQNTKDEHHSITWTQSNVYDENKQYFDKPIDKDNLPLGRPCFISHADLAHTIGLSVNNSIIIKCTVGV